LTLPGGGFTLPVPDHLRDRLAGAVGKHVVLGIRPEHFHLKPVEGNGDGEGRGAIAVHLNVVEPLGNDMDVYMNTKLHDHVVGRVEAAPGLTMDTSATVYVDTRKVHFFEPGETGMNLSLDRGAAPAANESAHALA
jgi:multiple sugar transport system ATP-binding protein